MSAAGRRTPVSYRHLAADGGQWPRAASVPTGRDRQSGRRRDIVLGLGVRAVTERTDVWYTEVLMAAAISPCETASGDIAQRRTRALEVERQLCELAARTHAAMAELSRLAADFNDLEGWVGEGIRSFSHWVTLNAGFAPRTGEELLRVGEALRTLPHIDAAFAAGRLSFDSVRELSRVVTAEDEDLWLAIATTASGAQLARICRACRRVLDLDTPQHDQEQLRRRGVWTHFEDDGMLSLRALLLPEEGALVHAAMETAAREADARPSTAAVPDAIPDPAHEPWAARRADALVAICEHALARDGGRLLVDPAALPMLVHVDVGVLTGQDAEGRRHLDGGPVLSAATIRRLGCDATVISITERDGIPLDVGRRRRILPRRLRRALQGRGRTCRFPGCAVPSQRTHAQASSHKCGFKRAGGAGEMRWAPAAILSLKEQDARVAEHRVPWCVEWVVRPRAFEMRPPFAALG